MWQAMNLNGQHVNSLANTAMQNTSIQNITEQSTATRNTSGACVTIHAMSGTPGTIGIRGAFIIIGTRIPGIGTERAITAIFEDGTALDTGQKHRGDKVSV